MNVITGTIIFLIKLLLLRTGGQIIENKFIDDICGHINGQRIYLEHGERGTLVAKNVDNTFINNVTIQRRCSVDFVSCPSCIIKIRFMFLNLSRNCGRSTIFDSCGCDYVWIYEPTFEQSSEQFCGQLNQTFLQYTSQTRKIVVVFLYNKNYKHAFTLDYYSERNKEVLIGNINNATQTISSPFFPNHYPLDLTKEHIIKCEQENEICRITLVFTDFLIAHSSIIDFFDWNGERIYVTNGNIFRPPVITTSGPLLVVRFYANGATSYGYKAHYSFILGQDTQMKPDIDCGGHVNNLGGGITMMKMIEEGLKSFDCIWLIKPPETYFHMKTHLYVKVLTYSGFAGSTELTIRQGLTSNGPIVENLKISLLDFHSSKNKEHVVSISQGFYISLKGVFRSESRLALVYAAFNYKDCLSGSDFLCHNLRCISSLLNCDGFDHCGDNSDEFVITCSQDRRQWSKTPNFLFPQTESFSNITTSTLIFLICTLGLIGFILAMLILLYRMNSKTRQQRQIQNHIETINAILEEGAPDVEEEIIIPDDPPDYEHPPDYDDVIKMCIESKIKNLRKCGSLRHSKSQQGINEGTSTIPDSPPPAYDRGNINRDKVTFYTTFNNQYFETFSVFTNNLQQGNCVCENFCRLIHITHNLMLKKYFSDTELTYDGNPTAFCTNTNDILRFPKNKKSFTTDDVNSFI